MTNLEKLQSSTQDEVAGMLAKLVIKIVYSHAGPLDIHKWLESEAEE